MSNPYPAGLDQPVGSSQGLTLVGRGFTFSIRRTIPYVHQFSVAQRELPGRLALDMSAVGSRTRGLPVSKGINEITAEQLATGAFMLQPVPIRIRASCRDALQRRHGAAAAARASFPQFAAITEDRRPFGVNDYDALQMSVNKRRRRPAVPRELHLLADGRRGHLPEPQDDWDQLTRVVTVADSPHRLLVSRP